MSKRAGTWDPEPGDPSASAGGSENSTSSNHITCWRSDAKPIRLTSVSTEDFCYSAWGKPKWSLHPTMIASLASTEKLFLTPSPSYCTNQKQKILRVQSPKKPHLTATRALIILKGPQPPASLPHGILSHFGAPLQGSCMAVGELISNSHRRLVWYRSPLSIMFPPPTPCPLLTASSLWLDAQSVLTGTES